MAPIKTRIRYKEAAEAYKKSIRTLKRWKGNGWIKGAMGLLEVESLERFLAFVAEFGRVPSDPAKLAGALQE